MSYAETYAELTRIESEGGWVEIDTDMGPVVLSATQAILWFEELSPGEGFEIIRELTQAEGEQE